MDHLGWLAGPEHLNRDVEGQWNLFERTGRKNAIPAFQALEMIVAKRYLERGSQAGPFGGIGPHETATVPWWVLWVLAGGWRSYRQSEGTNTLGQSLGIEGHGQGSHRESSKLDTEV